MVFHLLRPEDVKHKACLDRLSSIGTLGTIRRALLLLSVGLCLIIDPFRVFAGFSDFAADVILSWECNTRS